MRCLEQELFETGKMEERNRWVHELLNKMDEYKLRTKCRGKCSSECRYYVTCSELKLILRRVGGYDGE